MSLKQLLPIAARDRFRPAYQQMQRWQLRTRRALAGSALWPKPAQWRSMLREAETADLSRLYAMAGEHFGILQVEQEILPFVEFIAEHQPRIVGEIGLKHGGNTFLFVRWFKQLQLLTALDLQLHNTAKLRFLTPSRARLKFIEGNSYSPATVSHVASVLGGRRFDFLFIDGDHSYEGVRSDLVSYYPYVRPGGLIAFHDVVPDEFARTGRRTPGSQCYGGGVHRLWSQLKERFPHREFVHSWDQNGFGIGVITRLDGPLPAEVREWRE